MATPLTSASAVSANSDLLADEWDRLNKRRLSVRNYDPPKWVSNHEDVVSGRLVERSMVEHASIL